MANPTGIFDSKYELYYSTTRKNVFFFFGKSVGRLFAKRASIHSFLAVIRRQLNTGNTSFLPRKRKIYFFCSFAEDINPKWNSTWTDKLKRDLLLNYDKFARPAQHSNTTTVTLDPTVHHVELVRKFERWKYKQKTLTFHLNFLFFCF